MTAELVEHLLLPAMGVEPGAELLDAATVEHSGHRLAFSTDSYVVTPLFFPGGCIGDLAVNGTINDLAMRGARPLALSAGFIIEEGLELETLARVARAMGAALTRARVSVVAGDTKVIDARVTDGTAGLYINTAGIGEIPDGVDIRPARATPGDRIVVSGPIGVHGIAVLSQREGLEFGTGLETDSAPLHELVATMVAAADLHVLRDPTRGGLAGALSEIATDAGVGIVIDEQALPVPPEVAAACSILGLDALTIANEGNLVAFVAPDDLDGVVNAMHEYGSQACVIGTVTDRHPGLVTATTPLGSTRIIDRPLGEQLPRIC